MEKGSKFYNKSMKSQLERNGAEIHLSHSERKLRAKDYLKIRFLNI